MRRHESDAKARWGWIKHFMERKVFFLYDGTALETDTECKTFKLDMTVLL